MSTTIDRLNLLANTKADIKAAIIEKGQVVDDVFSTYADKIRAIQTGGTVTATDDGAGNVTITMDGATATYNNGNVTIE